MTKEIIESVKGMLATTEDSKCLSKSLFGGMKSKNYVSVMKRQKCGKNLEVEKFIVKGSKYFYFRQFGG